MKSRESGVIRSIFIVTVVVNIGVNELAAIRSGIRRASATTSASHSASSGRSSAEIIEGRVSSSASISKEGTSLALAEPVAISIIVIGFVPARTFEHGKGELTVRLLVDESRSHGLEGIMSSFEVRTSGGGTSTVFHISTLQSRATKEGLKSGGKGINVDNCRSRSVQSGRSNVARKSITIIVNEIRVKAASETKSMGDFVQDHVDVLFV